MRDINRIPDFLKNLEVVWKQYPDMRFGQLIVNCLGVDPFYISDNEAKEKIHQFGKIKEIKIDGMKIFDKQIVQKMIQIDNIDFNITDVLNTIEEVWETIPNSTSFALKDYEATSTDVLDKFVKLGYVKKIYGEKQSINYTIASEEKKDELINLYNKICTIIE